MCEKRKNTGKRVKQHTSHIFSVQKPRFFGAKELRSSSPRSISRDPTSWLDGHPNAPWEMHDESMNRCMELSNSFAKVLYPWPLPVIRLRGLPWIHESTPSKFAKLYNEEG